MNPMPTTALVMRSDPIARVATARALRALGLAAVPFGDESHLYAQAIRLAIAPGAIGNRLAIVTEVTDGVVRDLAVLRSGNWCIPIVLVGGDADAATADRLDAVRVADDAPTSEALRHAIERAADLATRTPTGG